MVEWLNGSITTGAAGGSRQLTIQRGNNSSMSTILTATGVVVRYGEQSILDRATLAIEEGDRIGLVGRNGCGKTTFLKLLAGVQAPDSGTVSRRRDLVVSYLSQDFTLDPAKTVG